MVPDYQSLMMPIVRVLSDRTPRPVSAIRDEVAAELRISEDDLRELTPSGQKPLFHDRIAWGLTYLSQAGVLSRPKRGVYQATERGLTVLKENPQRIDNEILGQFPEFLEFINRSGTPRPKKAKQTEVQEAETPEEFLDTAYRRLRGAIEAEILEHVKAAPPEFFERLVVELLVKMGYGGSLKDAGQAVGRSGDGGIDGIIKEDRLGLDVIHIQAKRWSDKPVGRPDVQAFAGSLEGVRARKGIYITTATYTGEAKDYVGRIDKRIVLIDGGQLASLMYDYGVGVAASAAYEVKRVDLDYFGEA